MSAMPTSSNVNKVLNKPMINLMQGDCLERMKEIESGSVDMVLADPPYEISNSVGGMMNKGGREFISQIDAMGMCKSGFDVESFLESCKRIMRQKTFNGVFFCSVKQLDKYINFAIKNKYNYGITYWHKTDPAPLCNGKYLNDVELCVYITKNKKIAGSYSTKSLVYRSATNRADKKKYGHPTIKPVDLIEKYLINHSSINDVIFDPFLGSGTTGVAAINTGRKFIGIELDEHYFNIAKERIEKARQAKEAEYSSIKLLEAI
jgi:site-specific DNA-methyltransferase (adenine-specific)